MKPIPKIGAVNATVTAPPSKSYSVRALLVAAMSEGPTTITNCLDADDTRYALDALRAIGFDVAGSFKDGVRIGDRKSMSANEVPIFVGNAGTAMRFLTGWLAFTPGRFLLQGEKRMHERPIGDLVDVLMQIGAEVEYVAREGYPPLRIRGKKVRGLAHPTAQGDARFLDILSAMGCEVLVDDVITVIRSELRGGTFDCNATPDLVPTLAAIAPLATSAVEIVNVANLRVKESDRLATVSAELRKLGARVEEREDSLRIEPGWTSDPATIETHDDHRIAMAFAVAGLARGNVTIANEQVVSKSYPRFWKTLDEVVVE